MSPDANTLTTTTVQTPVGRLHVQLIGAGPPAVLWHSLFVDSSTWCRIRDTLAEHRRLIIIDGPAHGRSEPITRSFSENDCATAALAVLDQLVVLEPVDWVGNAWGGQVGIVFAATEPQRCRSLIAIGAPVRALSGPEHRKIALLSAIYRVVGSVPPLVKILREALLGKDADPQAYHIVGDAFRHADRRAMTAAIHSLSLNRPDLSPLLPRVTAPTLFITGENDVLATVSEAREVADQLSDGSAVAVPGSGHITPLLQNAPALATHILEFWAKLA